MSIFVASRHLHRVFFKRGFMPYFLSSKSSLSGNRDRNNQSALVVLIQHKEKRYNFIFFNIFPE